MTPKLFVATKAFIEHAGKILVVRESGQYADGSNVGKYDIVGGRLEPGQHYMESLLREVKEETGLEVEVGRPFHVREWRPVVRGEQWQIVGIFFACKAVTHEVTLSEDHDAYLWIDPADHRNQPIIENLHDTFDAYLVSR